MSISDDNLPGGLEETWFQRTRFGKFLARPCVASSFLYGTGGFFAVFLSSFGWTSNLRRANIHGLTAFATVTLVTSTVCTFYKIAKDMEHESEKKKREEEKAARDEALRNKIEERKRKHEERKRLAEQQKSGKFEEA